MLNPIDTEKAIRDHGATGRFPGDIHHGVAWWLGSCLVATAQTNRLYVGSDREPTTEEFFRRLCRGAINSRHHACHVLTLTGVDEPELVAAMDGHGPGAYVTTTPATGDESCLVTIRLYDGAARLLEEDTGLAAIRSMIAEDRVPIPVNEGARGRIEDYRQAVGDPR